MEKQPYFSVIIPTLNEEACLPRLLSCLSKQTYKNFEVIIVDGSSSDRTPLVWKHYTASVPRLCLFTTPTISASFQRNFGAARARGEYFVFFDADVLVPPQFLEGIHYNIVSRGYTFLTTWVEADRKTSSDELITLVANLGVEVAKAIGKPFAGGYNTIVHRKAFGKVKGFNEQLNATDDHDFAVRVCEAGHDLAILKEPRLTMSLRRFRGEGTIRVLRKYTQITLYFLLRGPIPTHRIEYAMGGHVHKKKKRSINIVELNMYLRGIKKLQRKILRMIGE